MDTVPQLPQPRDAVALKAMNDVDQPCLIVSTISILQIIEAGFIWLVRWWVEHFDGALKSAYSLEGSQFGRRTLPWRLRNDWNNILPSFVKRTLFCNKILWNCDHPSRRIFPLQGPRESGSRSRAGLASRAEERMTPLTFFCHIHIVLLTTYWPPAITWAEVPDRHLIFLVAWVPFLVSFVPWVILFAGKFVDVTYERTTPKLWKKNK